MTLTMEPAGEAGVILSRTFTASPEAVFSAHVTPELIRQWMLGPEGWHMTECRADPRQEGEFLFAYSHADGRRFTISGTYLDVDPPRLIRYRETMTMPEGSTRTDVEMRIEPEGAGTRLRIALGYANSTLRDAVLTAEMQAGMEASYSRLDALLPSAPNSAS